MFNKPLQLQKPQPWKGLKDPSQDHKSDKTDCKKHILQQLLNMSIENTAYIPCLCYISIHEILTAVDLQEILVSKERFLSIYLENKMTKMPLY